MLKDFTKEKFDIIIQAGQSNADGTGFGNTDEPYVPALPFIAGDFVQQWIEANPEICAPVLKAIRAVCRDHAVCGFVETDGLKSNDQEFGGGNNIHFSRRSIYELGHRYFEEFVRIVG